MRRVLLAASLIALGGCDPPPRPQSASAEAEATIVAEARAFMDAYARDLLGGNREGIVGRYDPTGVHVMIAGSYAFESHASIAEGYRTRWQPPAAFEWRNLAYEPAGPDAVVVVGQFLWTAAAGEVPVTYSYSALLRRRGGMLLIRVEDEAPYAPPSR